MTPARKQLFDEHLDLAEKAARRHYAANGSMNGMEVEDYRQYALMGLLKAARKYIPSKGRFENFARRFCERGIMDGVRECDEVGRSRRADGIVGAVISLEGGATNSGRMLTDFRDLLAARSKDDQVENYSRLRPVFRALKDDRLRAILYLMDVLEVEAWRVADVFDITEAFVHTLHGLAMARLAGHSTRRPTGRVALHFKLPANRFPVRDCPGQLGLFGVGDN
jgi:RNA polymerase sigma factor (sigma-70 family)